jgi:hypothetical protein
MAKKAKASPGKKDAGKCRQDELKKAQESVKVLSGKTVDQLDAGEQEKLLKAIYLLLGLVDDNGIIK